MGQVNLVQKTRTFFNLIMSHTYLAQSYFYKNKIQSRPRYLDNFEMKYLDRKNKLCTIYARSQTLFTCELQQKINPFL